MTWYRLSATSDEGESAEHWAWIDEAASEEELKEMTKSWAESEFPDADRYHFSFQLVRRPPRQALVKLRRKYTDVRNAATRMLDVIAQSVRQSKFGPAWPAHRTIRSERRHRKQK